MIFAEHLQAVMIILTLKSEKRDQYILGQKKDENHWCKQCQLTFSLCKTMLIKNHVLRSFSLWYPPSDSCDTRRCRFCSVCQRTTNINCIWNQKKSRNIGILEWRDRYHYNIMYSVCTITVMKLNFAQGFQLSEEEEISYFVACRIY